MNSASNFLKNSNSLKARLINYGLGVGMLKILNIPVMFFASIVLARGLGPEGLGLYSFVLSIFTLISIPYAKGISILISREVSKFSNSLGLIKGLIKRAHQYAIALSGISIFIIILLFINKASWAENDKSSLLILASPLLLFTGLIFIRSSVLRGIGKPFQSNIPELLSKPLIHLIIISLLLYFAMLSPKTALISQIIASILSFGIASWLLNKYKSPEIKKSKVAYLDNEWRSSAPSFIFIAFLGGFNNQIGILVLGFLGLNADIAGLRVAMVGISFMVIVPFVINNVTGPYITKFWNEKNTSALQSVMTQSSRISFSFSILIVLFFIFFGDDAITFLYGNNYSNIAAVPLLILALGQTLAVMFGPCGIFLQYCDLEKKTLKGQLLSLVVTTFFLIILVPSYGVVGAAISTALGKISWNLSHAFHVYKYINIKPSIF